MDANATDRYGTVMIGRLREPVAAKDQQMADLVRRWIDERKVPGFVHEDVMICDDGRTIVATVFFASEAAYRALADDPDQAAWYQERLAPMLDGEPQWLDGHWHFAFDAAG